MQMLLKWGVQRGTPVLVKSNNPERIAANAEVFDWKLDEFEKVCTASFCKTCTFALQCWVLNVGLVVVLVRKAALLTCCPIGSQSLALTPFLRLCRSRLTHSTRTSA